MNLNEIKELMREFNDSGIYKMSLEIEDTKIKLEKEPVINNYSQPQVSVMPAPAAVPVVNQDIIQNSNSETTEEELSGTAVKSPVVGTFYAASAPGAEPYVKEGQKVNKGDVICIIEAMKMMNEIQAPITGTVSKILVKEEEMVEYDQTIMLIQ